VSPRPDRSRRLLAVVAANGAPVVGVLALGWSLGAVVVLYWVELGVALALAAVRATVAERPPADPPDLLVVGAASSKWGWLSLPGTALRVRVGNLPAVALAVVGFGAAWLASGAVAIGALETGAGGAVGDAARPTLALGVAGVVVGRAGETVRSFVHDGRFRSVDAGLALRSGAWPVVVVGLALVVGGRGVAAGAPGALLLGGVVAGKTLLDVAGAYADRLRAFDERTPTRFGWATEPGQPRTVEPLAGDPDVVLRPHPAAVLLGGALAGLRRDVTLVPLVIGASGVVLALLAGDPAPLVVAGVIAAAVLSLLVVLGALDAAVAHLAMEYRVRDDAVGYDRLLGEPQWRVPAWRLAAADVERSAVDRVVGTETLVVAADDRTVRLAHVDGAAAARRAADGRTPPDEAGQEGTADR
jgi:hypothetical protein